MTMAIMIKLNLQGCDGSVLLDDTPNFIGEKTAKGNIDSLKGFMLVDVIKAELDKACKGPVVSCADILAVIARDAVSIVRRTIHLSKLYLYGYLYIDLYLEFFK